MVGGNAGSNDSDGAAGPTAGAQGSHNSAQTTGTGGTEDVHLGISRGTESTNAGGFCCCRRRRDPPAFQQNIVILRHSERKDYMDKEWKTTEEGKAWPYDTPITEEGVKLAKEVAVELAALHKTANYVSIACSPYRRCMETAAEVAKLLHLPVIVDQEIGEVRDRAMPEDKAAHRSPQELKEMGKELQMKIINPVLEDGGIKLFGKPPAWPESLEQAKDRYVVRIETYIRKAAEDKRNMIIVTHADAVVAALMMFERGGADVQNMGFCARVIASRELKEEKQDKNVFADQWAVEMKGVSADIMAEEGAMGKYYEKLYMETVDETQEKIVNRNAKRTKTDFVFDQALKDVASRRGLGDIDEEDEEDEDEAGQPDLEAQKQAAANDPQRV